MKNKANSNKVAQTSLLSHRQELSKGSYSTQAQKILITLGKRVLNSRQIYQEMNSQKCIDLSSVRSAITRLVRKQLIEITGEALCPITSKMVRFYKIKDA